MAERRKSPRPRDPAAFVAYLRRQAERLEVLRRKANFDLRSDVASHRKMESRTYSLIADQLLQFLRTGKLPDGADDQKLIPN